MADDRVRILGCEACQFIGRICPPNCPLARHFVSGGSHGASFARLKWLWEGSTATECVRFYSSKLLRRIFVESAVKFITRDDTFDEEGQLLLVEAVLSEAEKELESRPEPEPKPALCYSSSSARTDRNFAAELDEIWDKTADIATLLSETLTKIESMLNTGNQESEEGPRQLELEEDKESRTGSSIDQNLGVNAGQDSKLVRRRRSKKGRKKEIIFSNAVMYGNYTQ